MSASASPLLIATRESRLALWQAEHVRDLLQQRLGHAVGLLGMTTRGDQILDRTLSKVGGKGLFVKELETALAEGRAHLAVHSLKDVPMDLPEGFELACVLEREDPRDALVGHRVAPRGDRPIGGPGGPTREGVGATGFATLADLPIGARVGTSSLRRVVQLRALRPDLLIEPLRGNLDTRLRKLDEGQFDAIVLAAAGLKRLGLADRIRSVFEVNDMVPGAGQGALGIEVRSDAMALRGQLQALIHRDTWLAVHAERAVSRALGGSCSMPLAAHAAWSGDKLRVAVALGDPEATHRPLLRATAEAAVADESAALALGERAAAALLDQGAAGYLPAA